MYLEGVAAIKEAGETMPVGVSLDGEQFPARISEAGRYGLVIETEGTLLLIDLSVTNDAIWTLSQRRIAERVGAQEAVATLN